MLTCSDVHILFFMDIWIVYIWPLSEVLVNMLEFYSGVK